MCLESNKAFNTDAKNHAVNCLCKYCFNWIQNKRHDSKGFNTMKCFAFKKKSNA